MAEPLRESEPEPGAKWADQVDRKPKRITTNTFAKALLAAGVIRSEDYVTRVVIDAQVDNVVRVYVERIGDERLLQVAQDLEGIEISTTEDLHAQEKKEMADRLVDAGIDVDEAVRWVMERLGRE